MLLMLILLDIIFKTMKTRSESLLVFKWREFAPLILNLDFSPFSFLVTLSVFDKYSIKLRNRKLWFRIPRLLNFSPIDIAEFDHLIKEHSSGLDLLAPLILV